MSIRSIKRGIAKEIMAAKGYTKFCKKGRGEKKTGTYGKKKHYKLGSGSWFASFWREATILRRNISRDVEAKRAHDKRQKAIAYALKMHKNGRSVSTIAKHMARKESVIREYITLGFAQMS